MKYWYEMKAEGGSDARRHLGAIGRRTLMCDLEGVVEWLNDLGEVRPEGEFGDDVREVTLCVPIRM